MIKSITANVINNNKIYQSLFTVVTVNKHSKYKANVCQL